MFFFPCRIGPAALIVVLDLLPECLYLQVQLFDFNVIVNLFVIPVPFARIAVVSVAVVTALFTAGYADDFSATIRALPALPVLPATYFTNSTTHSGITSSL